MRTFINNYSKTHDIQQYFDKQKVKCHNLSNANYHQRT